VRSRLQEHANDPYDLPTASALPEWFPGTLPLSGTAATPKPLIPPSHGEGYLSDYLNTRLPLLIVSCTSPMQIGRNIILTAER
jgi:hypothetical protein